MNMKSSRASTNDALCILRKNCRKKEFQISDQTFAFFFLRILGVLRGESVVSIFDATET
jgi:hypothetical protein